MYKLGNNYYLHYIPREHMRLSRYATVAKLCSILLTTFLAARVASSFIPALSQQQQLLTTTVLVLCGMRFALIVVDLVRGIRPWQRAIFPSIVLLVLLATFAGQDSALLAKVAAAIVEVGLLAVIVYLAARPKQKDDRPLEQRLTAQLQTMIPLQVARIMVTEMVILRAAASTFLHRRRSTPEGFSYTETSVFKILPLLLLVAAPVDIAITDLVLMAFHVTGEIWAVALVATDVYARLVLRLPLTARVTRPNLLHSPGHHAPSPEMHNRVIKHPDFNPMSPRILGQ